MSVTLGTVKSQITKLEKKYGCRIGEIPVSSEDREKAEQLIVLRRLLLEAKSFSVKP